VIVPRPFFSPQERAASRRRGQLVGLAKARAARLALAERRRLSLDFAR
jgi:hypothetical protein